MHVNKQNAECCAEVNYVIPFNVNTLIDGNLVDDGELDIPMLPEAPVWGEVKLTPELDQWIRIIELVQQSGVPNKDGCRIKINDKWNFDLLHNLLQNYADKEIIDLLKFGWPVEQLDEVPLEMGGINHRGPLSSGAMWTVTLNVRWRQVQP